MVHAGSPGSAAGAQNSSLGPLSPVRTEGKKAILSGAGHTYEGLTQWVKLACGRGLFTRKAFPGRAHVRVRLQWDTASLWAGLHRGRGSH